MRFLLTSPRQCVGFCVEVRNAEQHAVRSPSPLAVRGPSLFDGTIELLGCVMPADCQIAIEDHLDQCVDMLLAGAEWRPVIPPNCPHRAELIDLMQVAEQICKMFDSSESWQALPPPVPSRFLAHSADSHD